MYRKDTVKRYTEFINKLIDVQKVNGSLQNLTTEALNSGVSQSLFPFMKDVGILSPTANGWLFSNTNKRSQEEISMFIADFNRWKKLKKEGVKSNAIALDNKSQLTNVATKELIAELKRRGYKGKLQITKEISI